MSDVAAPPSSSPAPTPSPSPAAGAAPASAPSAAPAKAPVGKPPPNSKFAEKPAAAAPEAPPEAPKPVETRFKRKLKVDGQDLELDLSEQELDTRLQKSIAAEKRLQEAAEERKKLQAAAKLLREDPFNPKVSQALGVDLRAMAEKLLFEQYKADQEAQQLSPEQRLQQELEKERASKADLERRYQEEREAEKKQVQMEETKRRLWTETQQTFEKALASAELEKNPETIMHMAEVAKLNHDYKLQLTPEQLGAEVKARIDGQRDRLHKAVLGGLKGEGLLKHLGDDVVREVLSASVARVRGVPAKPVTPAAAVPAPGGDEPYKPERRVLSTRAWRDALRGD